MSFATVTSFLAFIISLATVGSYFYKAGKNSGEIENMKKEINQLKAEHEELKQQSDNDVKEIKAAINQLNIEFTRSFTELATSLNFIKETLRGEK
ncbi:MAG: hypothetical protein KBT21_08675 [Treponema sp.]|nr:hypothetical protein [Candidatus Treponema merdequi]